MKNVSEVMLQWTRLTKKSQRIFIYLQTFSRNKKQVFPSIARIAKGSGCCSRTVNRALIQFKSLGWVSILKNGSKSNHYFMSNDFIRFNFFDPKNYDLTESEKYSLSPRNVAQNVALRKKVEQDISTKENSTHLKNAKKPATYHILNQFPLDFGQKLKLTKDFSEAAIVKAVDDFNYNKRKQNPIRNPGGFLYKQAEKATNFYRKAA